MGSVFSTGKSAAERAKKKQDAMIAEQKQKDQLALAEEKDVIARKKALGKSGNAGRSLLTNTPAAGGGAAPKSTNLGGTV